MKHSLLCSPTKLNSSIVRTIKQGKRKNSLRLKKHWVSILMKILRSTLSSSINLWTLQTLCFRKFTTFKLIISNLKISISSRMDRTILSNHFTHILLLINNSHKMIWKREISLWIKFSAVIKNLNWVHSWNMNKKSIIIKSISGSTNSSSSSIPNSQSLSPKLSIFIINKLSSHQKIFFHPPVHTISKVLY